MALASALRRASATLSIALAVLVAPLVSAQTGSTAADGFDPNLTDSAGGNALGNVYAIQIQSDGKVLLAGAFEAVQPNGATARASATNIVRILPDGRRDEGFNTSVEGQINAMLLQPDGKIIIGGKFTSVNGTTRLRVARLNADGTLDGTFNPNVGGSDDPSLQRDVMALALQSDGKVVVGGGFTRVQPNGAASSTVRNRLARFNADGTLDTSFDAGANNMVLALATESIGGQEKILVGGGFTTLAGTAINRIARLNANGTLDTAFNPNVNNAVSAIALMPDGTIVIGGSFTTLQPNGASDAVTTIGARLARLNTDGSYYYVQASGSDTKTFFIGNADGPVSTIKVDDAGNILIGGSFSSAGGGGASYVSRLTPLGISDSSFNAAPNAPVYAIGVQPNGSIVLGGAFTAVRGTGASPIARNHAARVSPNGGLDADFRPDANGRLRSLAVQSDGKILIGGTFTSVAGVTRNGLLRVNADGSLDTSFTANINGPVFSAVQQSDGKIVIAGSFSRIQGIVRNNMARLNTDGSLDEAYNPAPNSQVNKLILQSDGQVVIAGTFTSLSPNGTSEPVARSHLARIKTDGTLDLSFTAQTNDTVWTMTQQADGKILLGGAFSVLLPSGATTSVSRNSIARINSDGTLDTAFSPRVNGSVFAIGVQTSDSNKVIVGGSFTQAAGSSETSATARNNLVRFTSDGALDTGFDPNPAGVIYGVLVESNGSIVISGNFLSLQPNSGTSFQRAYIALLTSAGAVDESFDLKVDILPGNQVVALAVPQDTSKLLIGGAFSQITHAGTVVTRSRVAQVSASNGTVDTSFNLDNGVGPSVTIAALTTQYDGRVLAAGNFASFGGTASTNLARFYPDSVPDTTFVPNVNGPVYSLAEAPIIGTPVSTQNANLAVLEANGRLRSSFALDSSVSTNTTITSATVLSDGKILLTGAFSVSGTTAHLIRLNSNGSLDSSFHLVTTSGTSDAFNVVRVLSDGKMLVGGSFTNVSDAVRNNIVRLNTDGTLDTTFSVAADNVVSDIAIQADGKILIGGSFSSVASSGSNTYTSIAGIARFAADGTLDADFKPTPNGAVTQILAQADGKIVVAGNLNSFKPNGATTAITRTLIARLNSSGTVDESVPDLSPNSTIVRLAQQADGKILVGGNFTTLGGQTRNFLARLNGSDLSLDTSFNPNPNSTVTAIFVQPDTKILIGGSFTALQPNSTTYDPAQATPRNRAARLNADGTIDATYNPNFNGQVISFGMFSDGGIVATGVFTSIQPTGSLLVGGQFTSINGVSVQNLALFGGDGSISSAFLPNPNGAVYAILQMADGRSVIGGAFSQAAGAGRNHLARFNADYTLDTSFNPNCDGDVYAVALQPDGKLVIGGSFTSVGGAGHANLARLNTDGSVDSSFNPNASGAVHVVLIQSDGKIVFTHSTGSGTNALTRVDASGSLDGSFNPTYNNQVLAAALQVDGKIVIGGSFTTVDGQARSALARLNADGSIDNTVASTFSSGAAVTALTLQRDGKILIGGTFTSVDGRPRFGLARVATPTLTADSLRVSADRNVLTWTRTGGQPEVSGVVFEATSDTTQWHELGRGSRVSGTGTWRLIGLSGLTANDLYVRASAIVPASPNSSSGVIEQHGYVSGNGPNLAPIINSANSVVSGVAGSSFFFVISATGLPTSYGATGLPNGLTVNTSNGAISGTPTQTGSYTVSISATNASGTGTATITIIVKEAGSADESGRVANLSVLAKVTTDDPIIAGFVISGSSSQNVLIRAVGPTMANYGVNDAITGPKLSVYKGQTTIHESTNWGGSSTLSSEFVRLGAFALPATSADAAVILTLAPGPYTLHVDNASGTTGTALAEIYDATQTPVPLGSPRLVNISARGVISGSGSVVGGFVISGTTAKQILVRALGPGLAAQNVSGTLADPKLRIYHIVDASHHPQIAENDNWETPVTTDSVYPAQGGAAIATAAASSGAPSLASGSKDAAVLLTLSPGVYTAEAVASDAGSGRTLVEVFEVQ